MAKMKRNRIGVSGAEAAAAKGPMPDQPVQGPLRQQSLQTIRDNGMIHYFPNAKGPKVGRDHPMYPGTDIFQRLKLVTGGPKGTTDPRDF